MLLGLYVDVTKLPAALIPGIVIGLMVLVLARPLSVMAAALPFRLPWREQAFLSYSGLRGAVPIVLALIPLILGQPHSQELVAMIVVAVVIYTLLQGTTSAVGGSPPRGARPRGRHRDPGRVGTTGRDERARAAGAHGDESRMHGLYMSQLRLPTGAVVALLVRDGVPVITDAHDAAADRRSDAGGDAGEDPLGHRTPAAGGGQGRGAGQVVRGGRRRRYPAPRSKTG